MSEILKYSSDFHFILKLFKDLFFVCDWFNYRSTYVDRVCLVPERSENAIRSLELELWLVVSHHMETVKLSLCPLQKRTHDSSLSYLSFKERVSHLNW